VNLIHEGFSPQTSGLASAFFTLVGTHGLHVSAGLLWILTMIIQLGCFKVNADTERRMTMLGIFWNFLDIVWIFVFTTVYLTGAL
jgi:cytochrome o ubiquinol oxidase subunit 3